MGGINAEYMGKLFFKVQCLKFLGACSTALYLQSSGSKFLKHCTRRTACRVFSNVFVYILFLCCAFLQVRVHFTSMLKHYVHPHGSFTVATDHDLSCSYGLPFII